MKRERVRKSDGDPDGHPSLTGRTDESIENQIISMAYTLAAERIKNGTASAQEVVHFLKLGSSTERLQKEKLVKENALLDAKTKALKSVEEIEKLYQEATSAMRRYSGNTNDISSRGGGDEY